MYEPLLSDEGIRLIILQPGLGKDVITCSLLRTNLSSYPYEALSYEWGQPSLNDPDILLNGESVSVRTNLRDALWHIRLAYKPRYLWIDALCIDQQNIQEKNQQVAKMGTIYKESFRGLSWLGTAKDNSDLAMDTWAMFYERQEPNGTSLLYKTHGKSQWTSIQDYVDELQQDVNAMVMLFRRSYWSRLWILQETQLPKQLIMYCGTKFTCVSRIIEYHRILTKVYQEFGEDLGRTPGVFLLNLREPEPHHIPPGLFDWLAILTCQTQTFWKESCSEPRDFVYALLGIASDCQNGEIVPNYQKQHVELYVDLLRLANSSYGYQLTKPGVLSYVTGLTMNALAYNLGIIDLALFESNLQSWRHFQYHAGSIDTSEIVGDFPDTDATAKNEILLPSGHLEIVMINGQEAKVSRLKSFGTTLAQSQEAMNELLRSAETLLAH